MERRTDSGPPNKRQRKAKSCEQCRNRKVRCDQELPCTPCRRSRDRLTCTYRDSMNDRREEEAVPSTPANGTLLPRVAPGERSYPHESSRFELVDGGPGQPSTSWTALDASQDHGIAHRHVQSNGLQPPPENIEHSFQNEKVRRLEERIKRLEDEARSRPCRGGSEEVTNTETMPRSRLTIPPAAPLLKMTQEKVELFSQSHWVHTAEKVIQNTQALWALVATVASSSICISRLTGTASQFRLFRY